MRIMNVPSLFIIKACCSIFQSWIIKIFVGVILLLQISQQLLWPSSTSQLNSSLHPLLSLSILDTFLAGFPGSFWSFGSISPLSLLKSLWRQEGILPTQGVPLGLVEGEMKITGTGSCQGRGTAPGRWCWKLKGSDMERAWWTPPPCTWETMALRVTQDRETWCP